MTVFQLIEGVAIWGSVGVVACVTGAIMAYRLRR